MPKTMLLLQYGWWGGVHTPPWEKFGKDFDGLQLFSVRHSTKVETIRGNDIILHHVY